VIGCSIFKVNQSTDYRFTGLECTLACGNAQSENLASRLGIKRVGSLKKQIIRILSVQIAKVFAVLDCIIRVPIAVFIAFS
jgi:hypothetical protein